MLYNIFEYGSNWKNVLSFTEWWIKSENFSQDIKKGKKYRGKENISIRDIDHTICVIRKNEFELLLQKNIIFRDSLISRRLKNGEFYINKGSLDKTGLEISLRQVETWLKEIKETSPYGINFEKTCSEGKNCNGVGQCFNIENTDKDSWKLKITADVIAVEK